MASRKKRKGALAAMAKFQGQKIVVIVQHPSERQTAIWKGHLGSALASVLSVAQAERTTALRDSGARLVVVGVEHRTSLAQAIASQATVVNLNWLLDALQDASAGLPPLETYAWEAPPSTPSKQLAFSDDEDEVDVEVLPKYACQRVQADELNRNKEISDYLSELVSWWEYGQLTPDEAPKYGVKVSILSKLVSLIKAWPVELTVANWDASERRKMKRQHYVAENSKSKNGGWMKLLDSLVRGIPVERDDSVEQWSANETRRVARELRMLRCGVGQDAARLAGLGVKSAADLVHRRHELGLREGIVRVLQYANFAAMPAMDRDETETIAGVFRDAALQLDLKVEVVGSYRRGKIGGHDVDIMFTRPSALQRDLAPRVELPNVDKEDIYQQLKARTQHRFVGGIVEITGVGHGQVRKVVTDERLLVRRIVVKSPVVPDAYRHVDLVITPPSIWSHALMGWSGSRNFQRAMREYSSHCHQENWRATGGKPIVGIKGWRLDKNGNRTDEPPVYGRQLDIAHNEHWHWCQVGVYIAIGSNASQVNLELLYEEDNAAFPDEKAIFDFFNLDFRPPHHRSA